MWVVGVIAAMLVTPGGDLREIETGRSGHLAGISSAGYGTAFAIGTSDDSPLLMTWSKHRWRSRPLPVPENATLTGVVATAKTHADVVGFAGQTPLIVHWDGESWTLGRFAAGAPGFPRAVDGRWIVGSTSGFVGSRAAVWRWDGVRWAKVPVPGGIGSGLVSVDGNTAVGARGDLALIVHWDGTRWVEETPDLGPAAELRDVAGDYVVGSARRGGLVLHRTEDGRWKHVHGAPRSALTTAAPDGKGGLWAAGAAGLHHYDGTTWTHTPTKGTIRALSLDRRTKFLWAAGDANGRAVTWTTAPRPR